MNVLLLSSSSSHFPLALEASLVGTEHAVHRLASLASFLASPLRAEPFVCVLEIGNLEDVERALIAFEWVETVQPQAPARFILLVASRHISLGDRAARFRGAEVATLPLPAKNILFKLDLQARLLQQQVASRARAKEEAPERGFRARWQAADDARGRVMILKGPGPSRGRWQRAEDGPRGGVRWRWVEAEEAEAANAPAAAEGVRYDWVVEAPKAPIFDEGGREWRVGEPPEADLKVLSKGAEVFSARKAEAALRAEEAAAAAQGGPARSNAAEAAPGLAADARAGAGERAAGARGAELPGEGDPCPSVMDGAASTVPVSADPPAAPGGRAMADSSESSERELLVRGGGEGLGADAGSAAGREKDPGAEAARRNDDKYDLISSQGREADARPDGSPRAPAERPAREVSRELFLRPAKRGAHLAPAGGAAEKAEGSEEDTADESGRSVPMDSFLSAAPRAAAAPVSSEPRARRSDAGGAEVSKERALEGAGVEVAVPGASASSGEAKGTFTRDGGTQGGGPSAPKSPARVGGVPEHVSVAPPRRHERLSEGEGSEAVERTGETPRPAPMDRASQIPAADADQSAPLDAAAANLERLAAGLRAKDAGLRVGAAAEDSGRIELRNYGDPVSDGGSRMVISAAGEESAGGRIAGGAESPADATAGERFLQSRYYVLRTLEELGDQNSSWQPVDFYRVYLAAKHRYYGVKEPAHLFPLWVYVGELAPEFAEREKAWKFYDRAPVCLYGKEQLPVAVASFLAQTFGLPELMAASASAPVVVSPGASGEAGAVVPPVGFEPAAPSHATAGMQGFFHRLRVFFTGGR